MVNREGVANSQKSNVTARTTAKLEAVVELAITNREVRLICRTECFCIYRTVGVRKVGILDEDIGIERCVLRDEVERSGSTNGSIVAGEYAVIYQHIAAINDTEGVSRRENDVLQRNLLFISDYVVILHT